MIFTTHGLTVGTLIEHLSKFDKDLPVLTSPLGPTFATRPVGIKPVNMHDQSNTFEHVIDTYLDDEDLDCQAILIK